MGNTSTLIITGYGVNSHIETARAALLAGSENVDMAHFSDIVKGDYDLAAYGFLIFPGGFLDGDDLGAAQASAIRWRYMTTEKGKRLLDILLEFLAKKGLILGICNGFQLLVKLGLLPGIGRHDFERQVSLSYNESGKYEDRWVYLGVNEASPCIFTKGLQTLYLPVRHGEGRLVASPEILTALEKEDLICLQYLDPESKKPTQEYPFNPNGSPDAIAGLTDPTGHILGLMPHPEAFNHVANHPEWMRGKLDPPGTLLFANAIKYLRQQ